MSAYLIDHPPVRSQFRHPRRSRPSGVIVVHTAENTPDFVAFDGGAEAVARFIQSRTTPGSYHDLADSDSCPNLVRYEDEAFHDGTGSNPHSLSVSIATRADVWPLAPKKWRDGAIEQAAQAAARQAAWVKAQTGIVVPATRITRDESERRVPGFISHGQRDPARRSDPGRDFPWSDFLARFAQLTGAKPTTSKENPFMALSDAQQKKLLDDVAGIKKYADNMHPDGDVKKDGKWGNPTYWRVGEILAIVRQLASRDPAVDVDEAAVAGLVLAGLAPAVIAAAIPGDIAKQVADEIAKRLGD